MERHKAHMDRFYRLLADLEKYPDQGGYLRDYTGRTPFPTRGVYFFREPGQYRSSHTDTLRIVRVGTHAVSANAKSKLWSRLRTHRGTRSGGGNHRGSVFRLHVGAALLAYDGFALPSWGNGKKMPAEVRASIAARALEAEWEQKVSAYIGAMSILWLNVPDAPGPTSMRARIEQNAIALLASHGESLDATNPGWLGKYSPRLEIRQSGLWNLDYVEQPYDPDFLDDLEALVESMKKPH
ncbi:hypothetical protein [Noviherbaspirillum sp. UKPF54]|uniref:hypothetical protein n=1 Tax=Noviherbaspirillum sp. UKPF54 TaxID=2601898 RepID=UPI0011B14800|nr:hypothetical protein [Noviherbaspirillum sp. UKPF54]QDZ29564.1 hypothetical protein FAY22_17310 [Noviherbaspirillum sp. UKPF54]